MVGTITKAKPKTNAESHVAASLAKTIKILVKRNLEKKNARDKNGNP